MRTLSICLVLMSLLVFVIYAEELPEEAICTVCAASGAHEGEPEKVAAWSEYQGKPYYFCSEACKAKFDADPEGYLPPVFPRSAPAFVVKNLKGEEVTLDTYKEKVVLLDFWATWCKPCEEIMPELQKMHKEYADKGFTVIGVSIDEGKDLAKKVEKFAKKKKITYPVLLDVNKDPAWATFKVKAIPMLFLINQKGEIVAQWTGKVEHKEVKAKVEEALATK